MDLTNLTIEELEDLEPSVEIDAQVAVAEGWLDVRLEYGIYKGHRPAMMYPYRANLQSPREAIPHFSGDVGDAWEGVAMGYVRAGCAAWIEGDGHTGYHAGCTNSAGRFEVHCVNNPALAMCLAALKANKALRASLATL